MYDILKFLYVLIGIKIIKKLIIIYEKLLIKSPTNLNKEIVKFFRC